MRHRARDEPGKKNDQEPRWWRLMAINPAGCDPSEIIVKWLHEIWSGQAVEARVSPRDGSVLWPFNDRREFIFWSWSFDEWSKEFFFPFYLAVLEIGLIWRSSEEIAEKNYFIYRKCILITIFAIFYRIPNLILRIFRYKINR